MGKRVSAFVATLADTASRAQCQDSYPKMDLIGSDALHRYMEKLIHGHHVPGVAIAVVHGREIASMGFGKASIDSAQNVTGDTLFSIGSLCKSLTAAAVAIMASDNERFPQVQFDAVMSTLLPGEFVLSGDGHSNVTVGDVLSHQTGMPAHEFALLGSSATEPDDAASVVRNLRNLPVSMPPRSQAIYCNSMYTAASHLVQRMSNMAFSEYLGEKILRPLNMSSTFLESDHARSKGQGGRMAVGYVRDAFTGRYQPVLSDSRPECLGAGMAISSVNDFGRWIRALVNNERPLSADIVDQLTKSRIREYPEDEADEGDEPSTCYAYGWKVSDYCGSLMLSHGGNETGYSAHQFFLPELKFGAVIFTNANRADQFLSTVAYLLMDHVIYKPQQDNLAEITASIDFESRLDGEHDSRTDDGMAELESELRMELCPDAQSQENQLMRPSVYTGRYWNAGYKYIDIQDDNGELFMDCRDRSSAFTVTFAHVCGQTKYLAFVKETFDEPPFPVKAEFILDNGRAVKMGIELEHKIEEYIWFERVEDSSSQY
ncbi:hypothetical protein NLG97_g929 [Lecanicillium saksenae]|uniref:Uncharacterized protein n=1 Tax=Lecanicillium saksenae TaxID=468837 RepID=A0ACC1R749_9HYPO|nr:hypothetical protein NLG97_g929 [Lecanicillium saksenae]